MIIVYCTYLLKYIHKKDKNKIKTSILFQVLKLQEKIFELTTHYNGENIQLRDICYTPLNTVDTGFRHKSRECRVTSVLGYWQSNHTTLDVVEMTPDGWFVKGDYLDHLDSCSK